MFFFFKCLFNNGARAVIFELHKGIIYSFVNFKYQSSSFKIEQVFVQINMKNVSRAHQINNQKGQQINAKNKR